MTLKLIITVVHHSVGESTVTKNLVAPLDNQPDLQSPISERFPTPDEALAKAKQLQAEAGGSDVARITVYDFRPEPAS